MNQLQKVLLTRQCMGWWPFSRKEPSKRVVEPITKDGRTWLLELRDMCERNFDNPEEAKRRIRQMQVEWQECLARLALLLYQKVKDNLAKHLPISYTKNVPGKNAFVFDPDNWTFTNKITSEVVSGRREENVD